MGLDLELRDGVDWRLYYLSASTLQVFVIRIIVEPVENEIVLQARISIDAKHAFAPGRHDGSDRIDSRRQERKILIPSPIERKVRKLALTDPLPHIGGLRVEQGGIGGHSHFLCHHAELECDVQFQPCLHPYFDAALNKSLESRLLH